MEAETSNFGEEMVRHSDGSRRRLRRVPDVQVGSAGATGAVDWGRPSPPLRAAGLQECDVLGVSR